MDVRQFVQKVLRKYSTLLILVVIAAGFSLASDRFLTVDNFKNIALQTSVLAVIAIGMTFVILTAGIDLSVGSVAALTGAIAAGMNVRNGLDTWTSIAIALLVGAGVGLVNGLLVVQGKMPPFVATLAMLAIARGFTLVYTDGRPIAGLDDDFKELGNEELLGIPIPVFVTIIVLLIAIWVSRYTRYGNHVYATGGDVEISRLAGLRVNRILTSVYIVSGTTAAIGGVLLTGRLASAQPNAAVGLELDAIAAPVLGGVSLFGGVGRVGGAVAGALILGVLSNGLNLVGVSSFYQQVIKGVVLVLAVVLDVAVKQRR